MFIVGLLTAWLFSVYATLTWRFNFSLHSACIVFNFDAKKKYHVDVMLTFFWRLYAVEYFDHAYYFKFCVKLTVDIFPHAHTHFCSFWNFKKRKSDAWYNLMPMIPIQKKQMKLSALLQHLSSEIFWMSILLVHLYFNFFIKVLTLMAIKIIAIQTCILNSISCIYS